MSTTKLGSLFLGMFTIIFTTILLASCEKEVIKKNVNVDIVEKDTINCLKPDPNRWSMDVNFNEKWIAKKGVKRIEERSYKGLDSISSVIRVSIFNKDGYLTSEYTRYDYPNDTLQPGEENVRSKYNYVYEKTDSFLFQHTNTISFYDREDNKLPVPDTVRHNFMKTYVLKYINPNKSEYKLISRAPWYAAPEVLYYAELFKYDDKGRLIHSPDGDLEYIDDNTTRLNKQCYPWSAGMPQPCSFLLKSNEKGQIVEHYSEGSSKIRMNTFKYNKAGELIKQERIAPDAPYITYTYHYY